MRPQEILDFWFDGDNEKKFQKWFSHGYKYDTFIRGKWLMTHYSAYCGQLDHWQDTKSGLLALVIVLDQFSRHIFRGTYRAYAADNKAMEIVEANLGRFHYSAEELIFLLMPYQHTTNTDLQKKGLELLAAHKARFTPGADLDLLDMAIAHQHGHLCVLEQFGRFPKRNAVLQRPSTKAEITYIKGTPDTPY